MVKVKKLAYGRCDLKLTELEDRELALSGRETWEKTCRAHGAEPRGIIPCKNYIRCRGEIRPVVDDRVARWHR